MKQMVLSCVLILGVMLLHAQQIPNAGFENWSWVGGWYENPDGWSTNNTQLQVVVVKDYNPYHGSYNMLVHHDGNAWYGTTSSQHPVALNLFYRTTIIGNDTVGIKIRLYNAGVVVDSGGWLTTVNQPAWAPLSIPLSQTHSMIDSISVFAYNKGVPGTSLLLDDLSFGPVLSVGDLQHTPWTLYPHPVTERSVLRFDNPLQRSCRFIITDMSGRILHATETTGREVIIDKQKLIAGIYMFYLTVGDRPPVAGKLCIL